jgi:hypothetical protein
VLYPLSYEGRGLRKTLLKTQGVDLRFGRASPLVRAVRAASTQRVWAGLSPDHRLTMTG